jgi:hypothetical protein
MRIRTNLCRSWAKASLVTAMMAAFAFVLPSPALGQPQYNELVRTAIQRQINDKVNPPYFSWMQRVYFGKHTRVEYVVDTPSGRLRRVHYIDDKPLNGEEQRRESKRVSEMIDPDRLARDRESRKEEDARANLLLASIPEAFDFTYKGSSIGADGHKLVTLQFQPRPGFEPPNNETKVFLGMKGELTLDETSNRLVKIDGTLFKDVTFGWGFLGRLFQGGRFVVEQVAATPTHWVGSKSVFKFDGKILLFKSLHINDRDVSWNFRSVPPMTVDEALNFLDQHPDSLQDAMLHR